MPQRRWAAKKRANPRVHAQVDITKNAVARFKILDVLFEAPVLVPQLGELGLLLARQALALAGVDVAWRTQSRTAASVRSKSHATWAIERSPRGHRSTISALNSGVNERRGCGVFRSSMVSMMDNPPGACPLIGGVRQSASTPPPATSGRRYAGHGWSKVELSPNLKLGFTLWW